MLALDFADTNQKAWFEEKKRFIEGMISEDEPVGAFYLAVCEGAVSAVE